MNKITLHNYEAYLLDYSEGNLSAEALADLKAFVAAHPELEIQLEDESLPSLVKDTVPMDFKNKLKKETVFLEDEDLIDYLEGNLPIEEQKRVELKLAQDKNLAHTFELYRKTLLPIDFSQTFEGSSGLKKTEDDFVLNNPLVAFIEHQLSSDERLALEKNLDVNPSLRAELNLYRKTILSPDDTQIYPDKTELKKKGRVIVLFGYRGVASMAAAVALLLALFVVFRSASPKVKELNPVANGANKKSGLKTQPSPALTFTLESGLNTGMEKESPLASSSKKQMDRIYRTEKLKHSLTSSDSVLIENEKQKLALLKETPDQKSENRNKELKQEESNASLAANSDSANTNTNETELSKHTYLLALEEVEDEAGVKKNSLKEGIWKRAVQLAKQANKLGVKSIDGQENSENKFRLSFNSFSVEKK